MLATMADARKIHQLDQRRQQIAQWLIGTEENRGGAHDWQAEILRGRLQEMDYALADLADVRRLHQRRQQIVTWLHDAETSREGASEAKAAVLRARLQEAEWVLELIERRTS
jgi:hypothetical protein